MIAFSFGPFIGFWSAYHGAQMLGALTIPNGGMTSDQRIRAILSNDVTVLIATPTYALRLAEVAEQDGINLSEASSVRVTIHAGEPGASLPATKQRIETRWGARAYDHAGATEVGAWGVMCEPQAGLHLNEDEFICEVLDPETDDPADEGELVITNLGRVGMPVIRYRTGDYVKLKSGDCVNVVERAASLRVALSGRLDNALIIRGLNVYTLRRSKTSSSSSRRYKSLPVVFMEQAHLMNLKFRLNPRTRILWIPPQWSPLRFETS